MYTIQQHHHVDSRARPERESIHSGQFMVSHFEAEEQDDEDNVAVPIPEVIESKVIIPTKASSKGSSILLKNPNQQEVSIDNSLSKLFQCMSLAYRQKLTSPKWNRFRGIRLRWKDKIRLNNVIWRCWHLQFIRKENTLVCQFASPLDVDTHNKPEAIVLEGKYWKRKLAAVTAEYKKWRMFFRNNVPGHQQKEAADVLSELDLLTWESPSSENMDMMVDEDYMGLMSDTLFSTITNQPFVFPDSREIARAGLADFIQPSLGPLQPNLDDYMDTLDPLHDLINAKLPTVPEEQNNAMTWGYMDNLSTPEEHLSPVHTSSPFQPTQLQLADIQSTRLDKQVESTSQIQGTIKDQIVTASPYGVMLMQSTAPLGQQFSLQSPSGAVCTYAVISSSKPVTSVVKTQDVGYVKDIYQSYGTTGQNRQILSGTNNRIQSQDLVKQPKSVQVQNVEEQLVQFHTVVTPRQQQQQNYKFLPAIRPIQQKPQVVQQQPQSQQPQIHDYNHSSTSSPQFMQNLLTAPHTAHYNNTTSSACTSRLVPSVKEEVIEQKQKKRPSNRGRGRSRSNTREPSKRPPLISAVSDPAIITASNSVLLTQLLASSSDPKEIVNTYTRSQSINSFTELLPSSARIKEEPIPILPQPAALSTSTATATLITLPTAHIKVQSSAGHSQSLTDPLALNTYSTSSNSPVMDSSGALTASSSSTRLLHSPTSSQSSIGSPSIMDGGSTTGNNGPSTPGRDRRVGHIHAEQKRRYNIKSGFDTLHSLIPYLNQNPNAKLSKAAMLQKGADYIRQLRSERNQIKEEMDALKGQIEALNASISNCQSMLPATGAPVSRRRDSKLQEMFDDYVRRRTMEDWKFWIFGFMFRPLLDSFNNFVSTSSLQDLYSSTMLWIEQHCTLGELRPVVLNSLRSLSTITNVLSEPEKLPDEARQLACKPRKK